MDYTSTVNHLAAQNNYTVRLKIVTRMSSVYDPRSIRENGKSRNENEEEI